MSAYLKLILSVRVLWSYECVYVDSRQLSVRQVRFITNPFTWYQTVTVNLFLSQLICFTLDESGESIDYYRPQTKFAKVMFLHVSVCPRGGRLGQVPPWAGTDPGQVHPPGKVHPPGQVHPRQVPPRSSACWEIRATSGRYASYWKAVLFDMWLLNNLCKKI